MKKIACLSLGVLLVLPLMAKGQEKEEDRVKESGLVLRDILEAPDKGIPQDLIDKAECVVVYPSVKKAAFVVGGSYGRGVMTCRTGKNFRGPWSAPTMMALEGASFGFQIGGQATDFVLLIMNERGASSVLSSKVKIGADASAAAGPVGRNASAETDVMLKAEILSWSRAQGLFAGISLSGSSMRPDNGANKNLYGKDLTAQDIVFKHEVKAPASARTLLAELNKISPRRKP
ncbi:lipid-binding SYLF domain-containing protein [Edaphobacter albus]|uniref:lipid-binding SYLF domain-containing protein n=1 Tax=Edaphobacter sp. 4G125 TaxID=2763071 RepID=UPI001648E679|nr:lipid-binding SYLF domain-containing protein [Edaphobacter sp. 4G125]QNI35926.1 lipid-binding SYLF domain-containing protein [Edaphobacter sp. 4G125]